MTSPENNQTTGTAAQKHSAVFEESLAEITAQLVANGSIELSFGDNQQIATATELLPYGMGVFVPSPRKRKLTDNLESIRILRESGFEPVPHIPARKLGSKQELTEFLQVAVGEYGVHRVLLIGGDEPKALGPYGDTSAVLRDGVLTELGISEVVLAGYPEGHPKIPQQSLEADLANKLELANDQGLCVEIVTQFCFAPTRILEYCAELALVAPSVPVYVGIAGPASTVSLIRYAQYCGVSASLRALSQFGAKVASLVTHTNPSEQLDALVHYRATRPDCNVIGVHVFSFGGFVNSATWMRKKCRRR